MPIPVHFSSLIPKMSIFTLSISCLTTFSLPWFMDLTFLVPLQYCSIASDFTSITSHMHNWVLFLLWVHLFILWGIISPLFSSSILGTFQPREFLFQCPIFCLFMLFMGFSRQEYWSGLPFHSPVDRILSDLSTMNCPSGWPHTAWLSFIELEKAVVLVWLDWLVFCEYGFSVFALWCPLATPTALFGFFLPWAWGISSRLLQQSVVTSPYLGQVVSPHSCPKKKNGCQVWGLEK